MLCLVPSSSKVSNLSLPVGGLAGALVYKYSLALPATGMCSKCPRTDDKEKIEVETGTEAHCGRSPAHRHRPSGCSRSRGVDAGVLSELRIRR